MFTQIMLLLLFFFRTSPSLCTTVSVGSSPQRCSDVHSVRSSSTRKTCAFGCLFPFASFSRFVCFSSILPHPIASLHSTATQSAGHVLSPSPKYIASDHVGHALCSRAKVFPPASDSPTMLRARSVAHRVRE